MFGGWSGRSGNLCHWPIDMIGERYRTFIPYLKYPDINGSNLCFSLATGGQYRYRTIDLLIKACTVEPHGEPIRSATRRKQSQWDAYSLSLLKECRANSS